MFMLSWCYTAYGKNKSRKPASFDTMISVTKSESGLELFGFLLNDCKENYRLAKMSMEGAKPEFKYRCQEFSEYFSVEVSDSQEKLIVGFTVSSHDQNKITVAHKGSYLDFSIFPAANK